MSRFRNVRPRKETIISRTQAWNNYPDNVLDGDVIVDLSSSQYPVLFGGSHWVVDSDKLWTNPAAGMALAELYALFAIGVTHIQGMFTGYKTLDQGMNARYRVADLIARAERLVRRDYGTDAKQQLDRARELANEWLIKPVIIAGEE